MEDNAISMLMDVKLDIRERKLEFSHMKSWSRYFVRVEAVKCFPCYMRISFFSSPSDQATDLIVRINIPGLTVQSATSRTKQHSYGLFWKNNRKRCCAYFALETQLLCERHLCWMKKSIRNLELYRQEMMQLRRASRTPVYEIRQEMQPLNPLAAATTPTGGGWDGGAADDIGIYQNLDNTQNIMDLQDLLGPLPTVPQLERVDTNTANWSRRISGISGIYEEISDDRATARSRLSRASIASGIYEEMRLVGNSGDKTSPIIEEDASTPPPPLPPRTRANTNENFEDFHCSSPAPEGELLKKKRHWLRLDSVFGRRRTTSTDSQGSASGKKPSAVKQSKTNAKSATIQGAVVHRDKVCRLRFVENKRNSFSSPDLSRLKIDEISEGTLGIAGDNSSCDNLSDGNGSCTSEFYPQPDVDYIEEDCSFASSEFIHLTDEPSLPASNVKGADAQRIPEIKRLNISERIFESFNGSVNSSTVNLVGSACGGVASRLDYESAVISPAVDYPPPINEDDLVGYLEMGPVGTGFNRRKLVEVIYRNNPPVGSASCGDTGEESIYMSMGGSGKLPEPIRSSSTSSSSSGVSSASEQSTDLTGKNRSSVDDKIASYYPNEESLRTPPVRRCSVEGKQSTTGLPAATTLPRTVKSAQRAASQDIVETQDGVQASFRTPKTTRRRLCSRGDGRAPRQPCGLTDSCDESSPKLYQKYATVARISSPSKCTGKPKNLIIEGQSDEGQQTDASAMTVTTPVSKRFGSLPRFGKIDLSPLRMKINSVLQRHNSGNL